MIDRCNNPNSEHFLDYGGRGIKMCNEWRTSFEPFRNWALANGYSDELTIDREDNDGHYQPSNCRWVTMAKQCRNRRSNVMVEWKGQQRRLIELCDEFKVESSTLVRRRVFEKGWDVERALTQPVQRHDRKRIT